MCVCVCGGRKRRREKDHEATIPKMADMRTSDHVWLQEVTALGLSETMAAAPRAPRVALRHTQRPTVRVNTLNALDEQLC